MSNNKIISAEKLTTLSNRFKSLGKKIVLCHGTFDLLHIGHIKYFQEAKTLGDKLIVTVTSDKYVNKGPGRPVFNEKLRMEAIASLKAVDFVALSDDITAVQVIKQVKPDIYCKGPDYKNNSQDVSNNIIKEIKTTNKYGGKIAYTNDVTFSSSKVINSDSDFYSIKEKKIFKKIKQNYNFVKIRELIEKFKKTKVLIVGETIIDQYVFCEALGKSGKEPVLVLRDIKREEYLGGAAAISRHLSQFCNNITLLSMVGEKEEYLNLIKRKLPKNVKFKYIKKTNSPTILKTRFLDKISNNKVIGVYKINDHQLNNNQEKLFNNYLKKLIPKYDLVIVSDYGHGLISSKSADLIQKLSKYLALNAQVNAANIGYHSMRNYKNVDCVIINEKEIRHELRDRDGNIKDLMVRLSREQNIKNLVVTSGILGSTLYNKKEKKFSNCEAFAKFSVDKIGAGDAMLSLVALSLKNQTTKDFSLLVGSLAAAQSVSVIGNKETIIKSKILKSLESILK